MERPIEVKKRGARICDKGSGQDGTVILPGSGECTDS
jgi:hypothetical protein